MKFVVFALAATALFAADAALAASRATDVDFLRANRCKGLATAIGGVVDPAGLDAFIKAERGARPPSIAARAEEEFDKARREGKSADRRARLTAELTGPCQAYFSGASPTSRQ